MAWWLQLVILNQFEYIEYWFNSVLDFLHRKLHITIGVHHSALDTHVQLDAVHVYHELALSQV